MKEKTSRRVFLQRMAYTTAGLGLGMHFLTSCQSGKKEIGLITGVIRDVIREDFRMAFRRVAEIGYTHLEIGGYYGESPEWFRDFLIELGLKPIAGGADLHTLMRETQHLIDESLIMGKKYLVCYWPWLTDAMNISLDEMKEAAENLNHLGEKCRQNGLRFAWHNHDREFIEREGVIPFEYLCENTDPELVTVEMDMYWVVKGGADPLYYLQKYPGRFELWHIKDMDDTEEQFFIEVGQGIIDWESIFRKTEVAGMKYFFVEQDTTRIDPMESIRISYEYLKNAPFVK